MAAVAATAVAVGGGGGGGGGALMATKPPFDSYRMRSSPAGPRRRYKGAPAGTDRGREFLGLNRPLNTCNAWAKSSSLPSLLFVFVFMSVGWGWGWGWCERIALTKPSRRCAQSVFLTGVMRSMLRTGGAKAAEGRWGGEGGVVGVVGVVGVGVGASSTGGGGGGCGRWSRRSMTGRSSMCTYSPTT